MSDELIRGVLKIYRYRSEIAEGRLIVAKVKFKKALAILAKDLAILVAILFAIFYFRPANAGFEADKAMHLGVSMAIAGSVMYATEDWRMALGSCMAVGLAKELYDEYDYGGFDEKDVLADAVGCGVGYWIADYGLKLEATENSVAINYRVDF